MAKYVFAKMRSGYRVDFDRATIRQEKAGALNATVRRLFDNRIRFAAVADEFPGMPWFFVAIIFAMECNPPPRGFSEHLHNGDKLTKRTVLVPKGRPAADPVAGKGKPYSWEESAIDALRLKGLQNVRSWTVERMLFEWERYNGWGYRPRGVPSAYLWSYTTVYSRGKYIADGVWSSTAVSGQAGAVAMLKTMLAQEPGLADMIAPSEIEDDDDDDDDLAPPDALIRATQAALKAKGYDPGGIDGDIGSGTTGALLAFRADNDLPTDDQARIDADLLRAIEAAPMRPLVEARMTATAKDLGNSRIVSGAQASQVATAVAGGVAVAKGVAETVAPTAPPAVPTITGLPQIQTQVQGVKDLTSTSLDLLKLLGAYWWVLVLALLLFGLWQMRDVIRARIDDHRTGKTMSVGPREEEE